MTIKELIKKCSPAVEAGEISVLEVEVLLSHALACDKEFLVAHSEEEVAAPALALFEKYFERVREGEPVAYILNEKEFYGLTFYVDDRVLVPRPETEAMVDKVIAYLREKGGKSRVIDVGTGSGNIAISVVRGLEPEEREFLDEVHAVDVSEEALEVAKMNVEQLGVEDTVHVYQSDLLSAIEEGGRLDVIVANLPYIGEVKNRFVEHNVEKYEPNVALFGGEDGLQLYDEMFKQILDKEIEFELLLGEFGFAQGEGMSALLERHFPGLWYIEKDLAGIERIFVVKK